MKKLVIISLVSSILYSCSSSGGSDSPVENSKPSQPVLAQPLNNVLCVDPNITFKWESATDIDKDAINYTIEIALDYQFSKIVQSFSKIDAITKVVLLDKGVTYYWRVKATDSKNASSDFSQVFKLFTEPLAVTNHLPFTPTLISPTIDQSLSTTIATLKWNATDPDTIDLLKYDVYCDTQNPPIQKVSSDNSLKEVSLSVNGATTYFWKVVVKDDKGGITIGQIWSFKTK